MANIDEYDDSYLEINDARDAILLKNEYEQKADKFSFNNILFPEEKQSDVYSSTTADLIDKVRFNFLKNMLIIFG